TEESGQSDSYLFFVTRSGTAKRTDSSDYYNIRQNGLIAINLKEGDELVNVMETTGEHNIIIGTHNGNAMTFNESDVRVMGRTATGVRGIKLRDDDYVVGSDVLTDEHEVRSEEHTSELQSRFDLVCRLLLEKKNASRQPQTRSSSQ